MTFCCPRQNRFLPLWAWGGGLNKIVEGFTSCRRGHVCLPDWKAFYCDATLQTILNFVTFTHLQYSEGHAVPIIFPGNWKYVPLLKCCPWQLSSVSIWMCQPWWYHIPRCSTQHINSACASNCAEVCSSLLAKSTINMTRLSCVHGRTEKGH